ncbi:hypothetical protein F4777DRAFT_37681 [Nemania sp. FL0916]|nr:hypothetical protein F4777DRAFT_37681 [Nemania sp. FL0916]
MSPGSLHFISIAGTDSADAKRDRQRRVRSYVTSRYYREQRAKGGETHHSNRRPAQIALENDRSRSAEDAASSRPALNTYTHAQAHSSPEAEPVGAPSLTTSEAFDDKPGHLQVSHPMNYLGQGVSDPFAAMPRDQMTPRMDKHLYYYVNVLMRQMRPSWTFALVRKKFGCGSFANADDLQLNAICVFASTARAMRTSDLSVYSVTDELGAADLRSASFDWLYFKGKTMRIINTRLTNPRDAISDHTIGAICELIMSETYIGNMDHVAIHALGLRRLVDLRRSSDDLPYPLEYRILEAYIKAATVSLTRPTIPFTLELRKAMPLAGIEHVLPDLGSALIQNWSQLSLDQTFISILYDIITTTRHIQARSENGAWCSDEDYHESIACKNLRIEYELLNWRASNTIEKACRIACLLYVNTCLIRAYRPSAAIIRNLVNALCETLKNSPGSEAEGTSPWTYCPDMLFWVLVIGAHCSRQQPENERFFLESVWQVATLLNLHTWNAARNLLAHYLFIDDVYQETLEMIWLQGSREGVLTEGK